MYDKCWGGGGGTYEGTCVVSQTCQTHVSQLSHLRNPDSQLLYTARKPQKLKYNEYFLMGWSESHISLTFQWNMTFTSPHQQIFIEIEIFANFFSISVNCRPQLILPYRLYWARILRLFKNIQFCQTWEPGTNWEV